MARKKKTRRRVAPQPPKHRTCGAMQQHFYLLETFPAFRANQIALEHATQARLRLAAAARNNLELAVPGDMLTLAVESLEPDRLVVRKGTCASKDRRTG